LSGVQTHASIELAEGSYISMLKSEYDRQQAEQSRPRVMDETTTE